MVKTNINFLLGTIDIKRIELNNTTSNLLKSILLEGRKETYDFQNRFRIVRFKIKGKPASLSFAFILLTLICSIPCNSQGLDISFYLSPGVSTVERSNLLAAEYKFKSSLSSEVSLGYKLKKYKYAVGFRFEQKGATLESLNYELVGVFPNYSMGETLLNVSKHHILYWTIPFSMTFDKDVLGIRGLNMGIGIFYSRLMRNNWQLDPTIQTATIPFGGLDIYDLFLKKNDFGISWNLTYDLKVSKHLRVPIKIEYNRSVLNISQKQNNIFLNRLLNIGIGIKYSHLADNTKSRYVLIS